MVEQEETMQVFAVKSRSADVRSRCTSGGVFWELAAAVIANEGVVFGCAFDEDLVARHVRCETLSEIERCMGSKYTQSDIGNSISLAIDDLKNGRYVLFTGTPCQVASVHAVVPEHLLARLLLVDLVCHGVPSPVLFQQHLGNMERVRNKAVVDYEHRPKNEGWGEYHEIARYDDGSCEQSTRLSGIWREIFYSNVALRPSCYKCPWMLGRRPGDITIGDFWGIDAAVPGSRDADGVSLVIVNSNKGRYAFSQLEVEIAESDVESAIAGNPNLTMPSVAPGNREEVWKDFWARGFHSTSMKRRFFVSLLKHAYRKAKSIPAKLERRR